MSDLDAIKAQGKAIAESRYSLAFRRQGASYKASCPLHPDRTPSFDWNEDRHSFRCYSGACGFSGSIVDLVMRLDSVDQRAAIRLLKDQYGGGSPRPQHPRRQHEATSPSPAPPDADQPPRAANCTNRYAYPDAEGRILTYIDRLEDEAGSKSFRPWSWAGGGWQARALPTPRPLYGLDRLAARPEDPVLVCEGEKAANAAQALLAGRVCITSAGGSSAAHASDWSPLRGRDVTIWPDCDEPGKKYADKVATILASEGVTARIVQISNALPEGWDLADLTGEFTEANPDLWPLGTLKRLLEEADFFAAPAVALQTDKWPDPTKLTAQLKPVPKFDANALLPEPLRTWVMDEATRMPCPPDFVAVAAIVALASVVGARCAAKPKKRDTWIVVPNMWGGVVGPPSAKKSPACSAGMRPLGTLIEAAAEAHRLDSAKNQVENAVFDARKAAAADKLKRAAKASADDELDAARDELQALLADNSPVPAAMRRFQTNDATVEKLGELLRDNPLGILVYRDELVGLIQTWEREGHEGDRAFFLEGWNGKESFSTDRIARGTILIPNLCLSIFGGIQPDKLTRYLEMASDALANDGMLQRFQLLVYPDPVAWEWRDRAPNADSKGQATSVFEALADFDPVEWGATPAETGGTKFPTFGLDEAAMELFIEWSTDLHTLRIPGEDSPLVQQHLAKWACPALVDIGFMMPRFLADTAAQTQAG